MEMLGFILGPLIEAILLYIQIGEAISMFNCIGYYGMIGSIVLFIAHYIFFLPPQNENFLIVRDTIKGDINKSNSQSTDPHFEDVDDSQDQEFYRMQREKNDKKNIGIMEEIDPHVFEVADEGLMELIEKARVSALSPEEYARYEADLKIIGDEGSVEAYGYDRGVDDGMQKRAEEDTRRMIERGFSIDDIAFCTGLTQAEVEKMM